MTPDGQKQSQAHSFKVAFQSIGAAFAGELHMKIHLCFAVLALVACAVLRVDVVGWCLVIGCIAAVFSAELFNTAIEALADRVGILHEGRLRALGTAEELKRETGTATLEDAFLALTDGEVE